MVNDGRAGADGWGIDHGYHSTDGEWHETPADTRAALRVAMGGQPDDGRAPAGPPVWTVPVGWGEPLLGPCRLHLESGTDLGVVDALPSDLPIGRHWLRPLDQGPDTLLLVRPRHCHHPAGMRASALAVQAYAARSRESWGIGDFRDLGRLGRWAQDQGIDLLALSPLHAPSPGDDPQPSPYYPSSRRHLNPLHLYIEDVPGARLDSRVGELAERARALLDDRRIDRTAAWALKREALERLFAARGTTIDTDLAQYRQGEGPDLDRWATFCAISEVHPGTWRDWPTELQHPDNPAVARFASDNRERVRFHSWLQWLADEQLRELSATVPLVTDLAVGVDPGGADAWVDQDLLALDARIGAPPDDFAVEGQDWGLPPSIPHMLRADGYETFARTVRANLRYGAGIRIDHILGLFRLYWVPPGGDARSGAYVRMPADELLAVLAIESARAGSFVVGEDLGTVEAGVREQLAALGVLGTRLLWFEDDPPSEWPAGVAGAVTTHDLPTIAGAWTGEDSRQRREAGLDDAGGEVFAERLRQVVGEGEHNVSEVVTAAHRAVAHSPVELAIGDLDDVLGVTERPNMPGTVEEWPNWSIALPTPLDDLLDGPVPSTLRALTETRRGED